MNKFKYFFLFSLAIVLISSCGDDDNTESNSTLCPSGDFGNLHLLLGNPSNAQTDTASFANNYLLKMDEYTLSYSRDRAIPNWVSWHLSEDWSNGQGDRQNDFRANPFLPSNWRTPDAESYFDSGFNRGHNCPSADRLCSDATNSATFYMTNMIPQAPIQNQTIWNYWECYFRYLAKQDKELYIVMGNYGQGGDGFLGYKETIVDDDLVITVPESIWKVAIVIPKGDGNDLDFIDAESTVIAIDVPNSQQVADIDFDDSQFMTTVDDIENKMGVGFDLFSNLPDNVQSALENQIYVTDPNFTPCW